MKYEGQICRGPMERSSYMLPVSVGCSYNKCRFCNLFKHLKYRELPIEQIEAELSRVRDIGGNPPVVFLGDGNAFGLETSHLLNILSLIRVYLPACRSVNMDATVSNISQKSDKDLLTLVNMGVKHLYLGIETGLDDVLTYMNKDHTLKQAYHEIERIKQAGLIFDAHIMTGVGGKGRGIENAVQTAQFFNRTRPGRVINFSLFVHPDTPLCKDVLLGKFSPASELENLREEKKLLELIETEHLEYDGFHDYIEFRVKGILPRDRGKMLLKLESAIKKYEELPNTN